MLQIINSSPLPATLAVFANPQGVECVYAAVKATFDLSSGQPRLTERQAGFLAADVYWGEPDQSSLRAAADVCLTKPSTDILLSGRAVSAEGPVRSMDVRLRVGTIDKRLKVFGNRQWIRHDRRWVITSPEPFERMPLRWELAFGGQSVPGDAQLPEIEWRNPVGRGLIGGNERDIDGRALPNIEDPAQLIATPQDRPQPAGLGPIPPSWEPRRQHAGTYDANWQTTRAPYLPEDFDPRFFNVAPAALVAPDYLCGGEEVEVIGCTAGAPLHFILPRVNMNLLWDFDGGTHPRTARMDTVLIEPDQGRLQMVWRGEFMVDKKLSRLRQVEIQPTAGTA